MVAGSVQYGSTSIVLPSGQVEVTAPDGSELDRIQERVKRRARWILRQKNFFRQFHPRPAPRQYLSGETHLYLGRRYRLKVEAGPIPAVRMTRGFLFVTELPAPSPERTSELLQNWYRGRAQDVFKDAFEALWHRHPARTEKPKLQIKTMRTRWGSLSKGGILTLNPALVQAPKECIEYVICHELCHLQHHDHSPGFFKLLARRMPDWEARKERLEKVMS